jgi:hypothetical protein
MFSSSSREMLHAKPTSSSAHFTSTAHGTAFDSNVFCMCITLIACRQQLQWALWMSDWCLWPCRLGKHYPTHVHSRDSAYPNFSTTQPDANTLCGALVSGAFTKPPGSTDVYTDNRGNWYESEAGIDYSGSVICALGGYAAVPVGGFDHCPSMRTPLTGRTFTSRRRLLRSADS